MNYFSQQMNVSEIGINLIKLHKIQVMMVELNQREYTCGFYLERDNYPFNDKDKTVDYLNRIPKIQERLDGMFQRELANLVDLNYIATNFTSELIDEISEIDPDGIRGEAIKIETRRK